MGLPHPRLSVRLGDPTQASRESLDAQPPDFEVKLEVFRGPLDVLLKIIEDRKLDITKVSLVAVTDQYLEYVRLLQDIQADFLTDFLLIAAKLLLIKSRALLPSPPSDDVEEEDEDVGDQLARQLREYKKFKEVAMALGEREAQGLRSYPRIPPPSQIKPRLDLGDVSLDDLVEALKEVLAERKPAPSADRVVAPQRITLEERIQHVVRVTRYHKRISFRRLLKDSSSRAEIIVTFLAILELIKRRKLIVGQEKAFGRIMISSREDEGAEGH